MDEANLIEVKAIIDEQTLAEIQDADAIVDQEDEMQELIDFEKLLEESNDKIIKDEKRKSLLKKVRDGLLRMGKVIVKGALAAGAIAGLIGTLVPALTVAGEVGKALISVGLVSQFADSGSKRVETFKAGRAPVACVG